MSLSTKEAIRKGAPNFTVREKTLLLNIIHNYKHIVENKETNATTWREKDNAWSKVANEFNSQNQEVYRTKENLKKYYDNIKKNVRKEVALERKELYKTGGGVFIPKDDPIKDLTLDLINRNTVYGFNSEFDGDTTNKDAMEENATGVIFIEEIEQEEPETENHSTNDLQNKENCTSSCTYKPNEKTTRFVKESDKNDLSPEPFNLRNLSTSTAQNLNPMVFDEPRQEFSGHVSQPKTPSLQNSWTKRRRPTPQLHPSSELNNEYIEIAKIKKKCF